MTEQLVKFRTHIGEYRWNNHHRKLDLTISDAESSCIICADFGATLDLSVAEKDNCSVHNCTVTTIFFVVSNSIQVTYKKREDDMLDDCITN